MPNSAALPVHKDQYKALTVTVFVVKVDNQRNWCWLKSHLIAPIFLAVMSDFELKWQCNQVRQE